MTLRVFQPNLESFALEVDGNITEQVEISTLIHRFIGFVLVICGNKTIYFPDVRY